MYKSKKGGMFSAVVIITGTSVGAGIFGIPYVVAQSGFLIGVLYMLGLGVVLSVVTMCYGEVITRTKKFHQGTGYADKYLGKWGKYGMTVSFIFGIYGALLAYMIGIGDFLYTALGDILGGSPFLYTSIFFILASILIFVGLGMIVKLEKGMFLVLIGVVILIAILGLKYIDLGNLSRIDFGKVLIPYGVILFAFTNISALPDVSKVLNNDGKKMKKAIMISMALIFIIYLVFTFVVVGIAGQSVSEEAITGLEGYLGYKITIIGAILGVLTMATSFFTLGLAMKEMYHYDYSLNKTLAWVLTCFVPFIIFIIGFASFIEVLSVVGAVTGGLSGIIIILMHKKAKKLGDQNVNFSLKIPRPIYYLFYLIFIAGIVYQFYYIFS